MKKSIVLLTVLAGCLAACQNKTPEQKIDSLANQPDTVAAKSRVCYASFKSKDTITLSYTIAGNAIAGKLNYAIFEKDRNTGTIAGLIKGDTIIADYTFSSEGKTSVRQVVFLKKGDQLLEGYGPTEEKDGKIVFTDPAGLKYVDALSLKLTDCK